MHVNIDACLESFPFFLFSPLSWPFSPPQPLDSHKTGCSICWPKGIFQIVVVVVLREDGKNKREEPHFLRSNVIKICPAEEGGDHNVCLHVPRVN